MISLGPFQACFLGPTSVNPPQSQPLPITCHAFAPAECYALCVGKQPTCCFSFFSLSGTSINLPSISLSESIVVFVELSFYIEGPMAQIPPAH